MEISPHFFTLATLTVIKYKYIQSASIFFLLQILFIGIVENVALFQFLCVNIFHDEFGCWL